ncbi:MAG: 2-phospho-L-lactate transferase [Methanosphaera sp. rholeuAM270]|nr:MAG: 2-phospho-L-lactate transferase [Methanosphaera sp. rholeuAM270]
MICVLSGGTGTPKLLQGIKEIFPEEELNIIVNTLENDYFSGVYVSADIDTVLYTMCDLINEKCWYGRYDDTFHTHEALKKLGFDETLRIGDKDRALKIHKTMLLEKHSLTDAVKIQSRNLGIDANILPMSNENSEVTIKTTTKDMSFHEFLITRQSKEKVIDVVYNRVNPTKEVLEALKKSDHVIIGPSNPVTSINPIISMPHIKDLLKDTYTTSVSPIIGENAVSGPAGQFLMAKNIEVSPVGVAKIYSEFLDHYIINTTDYKYENSIKEFIPEVSVENIILKNRDDKINLARKILGV